MVMLDLSADFDTLAHDILIQRLGNTQGLVPHVTKWFDSYLRGRIQRVSVEDATSDPIQLLEGAVQGSKMGCRREIPWTYAQVIQVRLPWLRRRHLNMEIDRSKVSD